MSETKTYVFPEGGMANNGLDPNLLLAMNGGGMGGFGNGGWIWLLFLWAIWGNNGNGFFGNRGGLANELNNDAGRELLMQAIQGNGNAISQLANNLNCSIGQVQSAINNVQATIAQGDNAIMSKIADCCCENRLAICNQTNTLSNAMTTNTQAILAKLDAAETRALTDKIDALRERNSTLSNQLSQEHQTLQFSQLISQATAPIATAVNALQSDVDGIKCRLPKTEVIPATPEYVAVNRSINVPFCGCGYGFGGFNGFGGWNNGSLWG
jgi:hypothetical protein